MYSYADRIRAVGLYIKLGKRVKPTIRQLGYPTKNALKGWCREFEQHLDLRVRCAARKPEYSEAQKQAAVEYYFSHDRCIASMHADIPLHFLIYELNVDPVPADLFTVIPDPF